MKISTLFRTAVLLTALIGTALTATAYNFEVGGIYYNINSDGKSLSVTYKTKGSSTSSYSGSITIPIQITYGGTTYSITAIGEYAFQYCSDMTSVTIPSSVTTIETEAFSKCRGLTSITIPSSIKSICRSAFEGCSSLTTINYNAESCNDFDYDYQYPYWLPFYGLNIEKINIGNGVKTIPAYFAYGLSKLTSVNISNTVVEIGANSFNGCSNLSSITIPAYVTKIGNYAFSGCTSIETLNFNAVSCDDFARSTSTTANLPFANLNITTINIGNSVQRIPNYFAYSLSKLSKIIIPNSVTSIGTNAFEYCRGLSSVSISNSVTSIGSAAFRYCTGLTNVTIPSSVTSISDYAFSECSSLTTLNYNAVSCGAFSASPTGRHPFGYTSISTINVGNSVQLIPDNFANGLTHLTSLTIGNGVTSIGSSAFTGCSSIKTLNYNAISCSDFSQSERNLPFYNSSISTINIGDGVKTLPASFVSGLKSLSKVTIPNTINTIGADAFKDCTGMNSVYISDLSQWLSIFFLNAYANPLHQASHLFLNDEEIIDLVIPNDITTIPFAAFYGYKGLIRVTIPDNVRYIDKSAFAHCSELITVRIGNKVSTIAECAFYECSKLYNIQLGSALSVIKSSAFYNCSKLPSIEIPSTVSHIGSYAFYGCANLSQATLPNAISNIEEYTFYGCQKLEDINLTNVQSVGDYAFYGCSGVKNMTIGKSLSWGENAFSGCAPTKLVWNAKNIGHIGITTSNISQLTIGSEVETLPNSFVNGSQITSVTIPNSVKTIGDYAFSDCTSLTRATIGNSVNSIGSSAFKGCSKLSNITIPSSVKTVGEQAFYNCTNLTSATIGNSVNTLENRTFYGCSNLKRVIIGNSVISIKEGVFRDCKNLTQVYCRAMMPPKYEANLDSYPLFEDIVYQNAALYVPDLTYGYYLQTDPWKRFMEIKTESYGNDDISFSTSVYPTSIRMEAVNIAGTQLANDYFTFEGVKYNPLVVTGLEPSSIYSGTYTMKTSNGTVETPFKFYTSELKMVAEGAKSLTETTVLLKAETNMADEETMCGFDWRLYEGPDDYLGTRVYCPVYDGTMAGTLKGLKKDTYYKYRPVYKSNDNNVYYGDWVTFYTGDVGVEFDPVVYTYNSPEVTQTSAVLQGVALRGSDEITEQGFEYWRKNGTVSKVTATGERMSANVTGLQPGTSYTFRAYLKAGGKTAYGTNVEFVTVAGGLDVNADGVVNIADINVIINYILSGNQNKQGDVNGDGVVNIADVNLIINDILGH